MSTRLTLDLAGLAGMIERSESWTHRNWRTIAGLPAPFIGANKGQHPRWRKADIDAFMAGQMFDRLETPPEPSRPTPLPQRHEIVGGLLRGL